MTMMHSVHIDHRHYHKDKHLPEYMCPKIIPVSQKVNYSLHSIGSWRFSRMNSGTDQNDLFLELEGPLCLLWKKPLVPLLLLTQILVLCSNSEQGYGSPLWRIRNNLLPEIYVFILLQ